MNRSTLASFVLTGRRHAKHVEVHFLGVAGALTCADLETLVTLIQAAGECDTGFVRAVPVDICRLRHALDDMCGPGTGMELIQTGLGQEYRLNIPRERLAAEIGVTSCFFELEMLAVITKEQADAMRQTLRVIKLPEPQSRNAFSFFDRARKRRPKQKPKPRIKKKPVKGGNRKEIKKKSSGN